METKLCTQCKQELSIIEFYRKKRKTIVSYYSECKKCWKLRTLRLSQTPKHKETSKKYYINNKSRISEIHKQYKNSEQGKITLQQWRQNNVESIQERKRNFNKKIKETFFSMYGNKCVCCGETTSEFLTIEHKLGQKGIARHNKKTGKTAYAQAIKEHRPDLYEVLCWNCNCSKGRYGYCPHQKGDR